ncbi:MAG: hypothetical protein ACEQSB_00265 [Undibacterium sp.]
MAVDTEQTQLRAFFDRRHPDYARMLAHWIFLEETYNGGRQWFESNIFTYHKEGPVELQSRKDRAFRFNHTREAVDLVQKYLFKVEPTRSEEAPEIVKNFWKSATISNFDVSQFMRLVGASNSIAGRVAVVVDNNFKEGAVSIAEAKESFSKIYAYEVTAKDILDFAWDEEGDGKLLWIKIRESFRDDANPLTSTGGVSERQRLWTREGWQLFAESEELVSSGKRKVRKVVLLDEGTHNLKRVPCVFVDHNIGTNLYYAPGLIDDIAYLDRAIANYLSNLDAIIQDQTFSQLAMPAQGVTPGSPINDTLTELGTKRIFIYDAGSGSTAKPEYLSPDPKQAGVILTVVNKIINEIYNTIGLSGERTKEDNAVGIDNSSGVAKAYDFERVNSLLLSKAKSCEIAENEIAEIVCLWAGESIPKENLVKYPDTFDVMRLADDLTVAESLGKIMAPLEVRREQMKSVVDKLFPQLKKEIKEKIMADIGTWLEGTDVLISAPTAFGNKTTTAPKRQGQVTNKTV